MSTRQRTIVLLVVVGLMAFQAAVSWAAEEGPKQAAQDFLAGIKKPTRLMSDASQACWGPDGTRICFTRNPGGQDSAGGISILTLDGTGKTQEITPDGKDATWSPDGKWIAFLREGKEGFGESVWLVSADGKGAPVFMDEGGSVYWSPDSKSVVYHSRSDSAVYRMGIAEGQREKQKLLDMQYWYPRPSPDGREVAYPGGEGLCISAMDGSAVRSKSIEMSGFCGGWSPDGKKIAYGGFFGSGMGLRVIDASLKSEPVILLPGNWSRPSWSPDGKFIVFDTMSEPLSVWIMNVEGMGAAVTEAKPSAAEVEKPPAPEPGILAFDDFDGKLSLDWHILKADPTHFSLSKNPGMLTITTQKGALGAERKDYRNLFLIDCPTRRGADFEITTCIVSFKPLADWNQAGLICYNDDDNFLKWVYEWTGNNIGNGRRTFTRGRETGGSPAYEWLDAPQELDKVWLRVSKQGNSYTFWTSLDGKSFSSHGTRTWGDGSVKQVGLLAKNGTPSTAPDIDALFDFFEVRSPAAEAERKAKPLSSAEAGKFRIPEENLQIPEEMQVCAENFRRIHGALQKYRKDKGELPNWLSDLVPDYLGADTLFCPNDPDHKSPYAPDPKIPCSYGYSFSPIPIPSYWDPNGRTLYREWKTGQVKLFGDVVPTVSCHHHGEKHLQLSVGGQIYWGPLIWERMFIPDYRFGDEQRAEKVPPAPGEAPKRKFEIPEQNLQIPEEMKACAEKLRVISEAIKKYEKDKGKLPDWLSELVPDYLSNETLFCPNDAEHKAPYSPDPKLACSYGYEFSSAQIPSGWDPSGRSLYRDWKPRQVKLFGDIVPLVRCHHHGERVINVSVGGQIYWGDLNWEWMFNPDYRFGDESSSTR